MNPQLTKARELIKTKHYQEARQLLKTIDDPAALHLLQALDSVVPEPPVVVVRRSTQPLPENAALPPAAPPTPKTTAPLPEPPSEKHPSLAISDATMSRFPEGKDKIQMLKAGELMKAGQFAEAQYLLEKIDHPKAREWQQRIEQHTHKRATSQVAAAVVVDGVPIAKPLPGMKSRPLPETPEAHRPRIALLMILLVLLILSGVGFMVIYSAFSA